MTNFIPNTDRTTRNDVKSFLAIMYDWQEEALPDEADSYSALARRLIASVKKDAGCRDPEAAVLVLLEARHVADVMLQIAMHGLWEAVFEKGDKA